MQKRWAIGALVVVAAACGAGDSMAGEAMEDAGGFLEDAGGLIADAGSWLADAGTDARDGGDAQAQVPSAVELACDKSYVLTQTSGTSKTEQTQYFAELTVDTAGVVGVDAVMCQREVLGTDPLIPSCPQGASCTGTARPPIPDCQASSGAELEPNLVRVFCGSRTRQMQGATVSFDSGYRFKSVRVTVRR